MGFSVTFLLTRRLVTYMQGSLADPDRTDVVLVSATTLSADVSSSDRKKHRCAMDISSVLG